MLTEQNGIQVDKFEAPTDWQYSFPEGYTRLEYLESTGTQYIDTGVNFTEYSYYDITFQVLKDTTNQVIIGTNTSFATNSDVVMMYSSYKNFLWYFYQSYATLLPGNSPYLLLKNRIVKSIENNIATLKIYNGGLLLDTKSKTNENFSNLSYFLFAINVNGNVANRSDGLRIYNAKLYNENGLVRNLIPAKRNSDNKPGMYDLVNNVFYTNSGTGEFVMGPELYSNNSQIDIRQKNNTNFVEKYKFNSNNELVWANPQLNLSGPVGYTKVGNPTITDNVVSGFSASDYLKLQQQFQPADKNWEIVIKANITELNVVQTIIGSSTNNRNTQLSIRDTNTLRLYLTFNGIVDNFSLNSSLTVSTGIYFFKISFNSSQYKVDVSTNGSDYINYISQNSTRVIYDNSPVLALGYNGRNTAEYFRGSIDLKETYIKVNDKLWFYGKNYTSENYAPVPAGFAYNNTTTPSIGYVNTQTQEFIPAPTDGIKYSQTRDLKVIPPEDNTITLLYGVASDFSKYALFGLLADTSSGTYDVYIDDILYATTTKNTQTDIDFSTLGSEYVPIGTATTPEALVLHKIVVKPNTNGETITTFRCARTSGASGTQIQGVLWCHFELENEIYLNACFRGSSDIYYQPKMKVITSKGDYINLDNSTYFNGFSYKCPIEYYPTIKGKDIRYNLGYSFNSSKAKRIKFKNIYSSNSDNVFNNMQNLEQLNTNRCLLSNTSSVSNFLENSIKLKMFPFYDKNNIFNNNQGLKKFITNATNLYPTKFNISDAKNVTEINISSSSTYPMRGLRGLKVSNEAPFTGTSPQINVSYTGLDRDALVELFESMPGYMQLTKVGEPTIDSNGVASGFSSANYFTVSLVSFNKYEIGVKFNTTTINTQQPTIAGSSAQGTLGIEITSANKVLFRVAYYNTNNNLSFKEISTTQIISANTWYKAKAIFDKSTLKVFVYLYDNNGILIDSNSSSITNFSSLYMTGVNIGYQFQRGTFNGSIDLENTYVKLDNNYIMKGYLLDSDRAIATNKDWDITG